jgi:hypothetical protein
MHVSIMLAGFSFGLAVAGVGEPRRLARQLFAVTEGFLGPLFFVWLGASLDLHELGRHPSFILLGFVLGVGAAVTHAAMRLTGQPLPIGALASAQLGVPVAAATVGSQLHLLEPGEPAALILGALVTIAVASLSGGLAVRAGLVTAASPPGPSTISDQQSMTVPDSPFDSRGAPLTTDGDTLGEDDLGQLVARSTTPPRLGSLLRRPSGGRGRGASAGDRRGRGRWPGA